jgi:hypothetical protein
MKSQTHKGEQQSFNRLRNETWSVAAEQVSASPFKDEVKNFGIVCRIHGISGECSSQRAFEPLRSGWICQHLRNFRIFRRAGFLVVHHVRFLLDGLSCLSRSSSIPDYFRPSSFGSLTPRSKPNRTSQRRTNLLFPTPCPAAVLARFGEHLNAFAKLAFPAAYVGIIRPFGGAHISYRYVKPASKFVHINPAIAG